MRVRVACLLKKTKLKAMKTAKTTTTKAAAITTTTIGNPPFTYKQRQQLATVAPSGSAPVDTSPTLLS